MGEILLFRRKKPADSDEDFAELTIEITEGGAFRIARSGNTSDLATEQLRDGARAMQIQILCMAQHKITS